jgi:hypothetical protein
MKEEKWIDIIFQKEEDSLIVQNFNKGMSPHDIAYSMNISEDFVKEVCEGQRFAERADQDMTGSTPGDR